MNALILACALALPPTTFLNYRIPAYPRHVEIYKLLKLFALAEKIDWTNIYKERILVVGYKEGAESLVHHMRSGGLLVFGQELRHIRRPHYVWASFESFPWRSGIFHLIFAPDILVRFDETAFFSELSRKLFFNRFLGEVDRTLKPLGYFMVDKDSLDRVVAVMIGDFGLDRLPINLNGMAIFQKRKQRYPGGKMILFQKKAA